VRLAGKRAVVTGSTKSIGLGIARAFVREGARVVVNARNADECRAIARELGDCAVAIPADLSQSDEVRRLAREALQALEGNVDILVNNAGQPCVAPSTELAEADNRYTLDLNLTAYFVLSQELGRGMLERGRGSVINVGSMNGTQPFPQRLAYCVSKAGVNMLTKVMAIEWAASGVRVNCIAPGYVETEIVRGLAVKGRPGPVAPRPANTDGAARHPRRDRGRGRVPRRRRGIVRDRRSAHRRRRLVGVWVSVAAVA
jgi:NAD(P)-dependent dehydrogenase (short-subunit alcohol dehydrogenase family)